MHPYVAVIRMRAPQKRRQRAHVPCPVRDRAQDRYIKKIKSADANTPATPFELESLATQVINQVANAARVSPLVVVPRDDLDAIAVYHAGHGCIHNR
jgi:hypothetical protein